MESFSSQNLRLAIHANINASGCLSSHLSFSPKSPHIKYTYAHRFTERLSLSSICSLSTSICILSQSLWCSMTDPAKCQFVFCYWFYILAVSQQAVLWQLSTQDIKQDKNIKYGGLNISVSGRRKGRKRETCEYLFCYKFSALETARCCMSPTWMYLTSSRNHLLHKTMKSWDITPHSL